MLPTIPRPEDYEVDPCVGFLPTELPLECLPDPYYAKWETIGKNLQGLILSRRLRGVVDRLPILSTQYLQNEAEWRRAYSLLAFISHAYIWGGDKPLEVVPPSISIPFLSTCDHLELPPVATYAGVALWNYKPLFSDEAPDTLDNLATLLTFTGSLDESWFYLISVAIETRAGPIVPLMLSAIQAARNNDSRMVTACLQSFAERLDELASLLGRMYENCDPHVFYHRIRPFLAGSKNMADAGLPNGVIFDDGTGTSDYVQYSGGSNAQSSVIQFFDLVLGIEHRPTGTKPNNGTAAAPPPEGTGPPPPSHNFIHDMRKYMPGPHRRFLGRVAEVANIRDYVLAHQADQALATSYDACLAMLRNFRDKHVQMVSRYIIIKSRETRRDSTAASPTPASSTQKVNIANTQSADGGKKKDLRGTGGTALIPFLKQARDETGEPAIGSWARRLLGGAPAGFESVKGGARLGAVTGEARDGAPVQIKGLSGIWMDNGEMGGICHW